MTLEGGADAVEPVHELGKGTLHISAVAYCNSSNVLLLIHPHGKGMVGIGEDPAGVRPMATSSAGQYHSRVRVVEKQSVLLQFLLLLLVHATWPRKVAAGASERVVVALQTAIEFQERPCHYSLNLPSLLKRHSWCEVNPLEVPGSTDLRGHGVRPEGIRVRGRERHGVLEADVRSAQTSIAVAFAYHGIEQLLESVVALLVTCCQTQRPDHGVAEVVHASFDALRQ
mmetsp:Transcript_72789/g.157987  ORF Transcript_72789/g.157987 Transcript_72789/m.157987 type:complete len:227 (+) Transcript_72789:1338-2018(+)